MKRLIKPLLVCSVGLLLLSHVEMAVAEETDANDSEAVEQSDDQLEISQPESVINNTTDEGKRGIDFETIYQPEEPTEPQEPTGESDNVLTPAEPEEEKIDELINNENDNSETETPTPTEPEEEPVEEEVTEEEPVEEEVTEEEPVEEDVTEEEPVEEVIEEETPEEEVTEEAEEKTPAVDDKGKLTEAGINQLDEQVNSIMSKPIAKSDKSNRVKTQQPNNNQSHNNDDAFIMERMQKFLFQQSSFISLDKTFVREVVVERIVGKHKKPVRLPL